MLKENINRRDSIKTRMTIWVTTAVVVVVALAGLYFDDFLKESSLRSTVVRMQHGFDRLVSNLRSIEKSLKHGVDFARTDEQLIASLELINNYQDKRNYNTYLIDEEKKTLASQLLNRVKLSANDDIALYDERGELVTYVVKKDGKYQLGFISYRDNRRRIYIRHEDQREFSPGKQALPENITLHHQFFYNPAELRHTTALTYHYLGDRIAVKSHVGIYVGNKQSSVGQVEMSRVLGQGYFEGLSKVLNLHLRHSFDKANEPGSISLDKDLKQRSVVVRQSENFYTSVMSQPSIDGPIFYIAQLDKAVLNALLNEGRIRMLTYLLVVAVMMMLLIRYFIHSKIDEPISGLMEQIRKIENQDYSVSAPVSTRDEFEKISNSINHLATIVQEREESLEQSMRKMEYLSNHDALTDLPNRRIYTERLDHGIDLARRNGDKLAVMFLDLDQFKLINDTLGHDIGDELLVQVSRRLEKNVRTADTLARIGGDEFNILVENAPGTAELKKLAEKLVGIFNEPFNCKGHKIHVTVSIGVAVFPENGRDGVTLIKHADLAMYSSKDQGRNRYTFYADELSVIAAQQAALINDLEEALASGDQFELHYQPKVRANTHQVVSLEALLRWNRPGYGQVMPDQFISVAEESGLIIQIGEWVLRQACQDYMELQKNGCDLHHISINISNVQLTKGDLFDQVKKTVETTGIHYDQIELEITESYIATDVNQAIDMLKAFREKGVGLAIDDFGTGYSSMNYLQRLPVTRLKIDKTFIHGLDRSTESATIIRAIIGLAKSCNLAITVEGVEKVDQLEFLEHEACDEIQGYYFSRPLSLDDFKVYYQSRQVMH